MNIMEEIIIAIFLPSLTTTSTWTPPDGKFSALDHYIDRCRRSIASQNYSKRPYLSNLTQDEKTALQDLQRRNLHIQEAKRQLSDNRFYQRLDDYPIPQDQKSVKNTIKDMIASCALPPTAKHLVVTTPRTSCFYVTQDSQTEQPWASHCFCMLLSNREHLSVP